MMLGTLHSRPVTKYWCPSCGKLNTELGLFTQNHEEYSICLHCDKEAPTQRFTPVQAKEYYYECKQCGSTIEDTPENQGYIHTRQETVVICPHCKEELGPTLTK